MKSATSHEQSFLHFEMRIYFVRLYLSYAAHNLKGGQMFYVQHLHNPSPFLLPPTMNAISILSLFVRHVLLYFFISRVTLSYWP